MQEISHPQHLMIHIGESAKTTAGKMFGIARTIVESITNSDYLPQGTDNKLSLGKPEYSQVLSGEMYLMR